MTPRVTHHLSLKGSHIYQVGIFTILHLFFDGGHPSTTGPTCRFRSLSHVKLTKAGALHLDCRPLLRCSERSAPLSRSGFSFARFSATNLISDLINYYMLSLLQCPPTFGRATWILHRSLSPSLSNGPELFPRIPHRARLALVHRWCDVGIVSEYHSSPRSLPPSAGRSQTRLLSRETYNQVQTGFTIYPFYKF